jgi:hypothetical protein
MKPNKPMRTWEGVMNTLHETQRAFSSYVLRGLSQELAATSIKGNGLAPLQRLAIYRNNTQLGLTEALRDGYPVVNKLVGVDFFNHLARSYLRRHPPKAGCLLSFGSELADFIAEFQNAEGLPYLCDVARLEWCWHEAFHEADASALSSDVLATIDPSAYTKLGFTLHPSVRFLTSNFPILRIWQTNQENYQGDDHTNLDEGGCHLLIYRPDWDVLIMELCEADYHFLNLLDMKLTLNQAVEQVLIKAPHFNVQAILQQGMKNGFLTGIFLKP